jgi:hypothetical protein
MARAESTVSAPGAWQVRWAAVLLAAFLLPAAVTDIRDALTRPFWADEVVTAAVAHLGKPSAIWDALAHAPIRSHRSFFATALAHVVSDEQLGAGSRRCSVYLVPFVSTCLFHAGSVSGAASSRLVASADSTATLMRPYGLELGCWPWPCCPGRELKIPAGSACSWAPQLAVASHYGVLDSRILLAEAARTIAQGTFVTRCWPPSSLFRSRSSLRCRS